MPFVHDMAAESAGSPNLKIKAITKLVLLHTVLPDPMQELKVQSNPLTTFAVFKELPREVRLIVWRAALPQPQLHNLDTEVFWLRKDTSTYFQNAPPLPSALHTNHESRVESLRHYKLFWTISYYPRGSDNLPRWANPAPSAHRPTRPICIHLAHDMVPTWRFDSISLPDINPPAICEEYTGVQNLVVEGVNVGEYWLFSPHELPYYIPFLSGFSSLKKLVLIPRKDEEPDWYKDAEEFGGENIRGRIEAYMKHLQIQGPSRSVPEVVMLPPQPMTNALCYL